MESLISFNENIISQEQGSLLVESNQCVSDQKWVLVGNEVTDINILLNIDDKLLGLVCQTNKYANRLCNENYFWGLKLDKLYSGIPIPSENKDNIKQLYIDISPYVNNISQFSIWIIENGYLKILKWLVTKYNIILNYWDANHATRKGHLEVLKWLIKNNIFPDGNSGNDAACSGHLEVLKLLAKHNIFPDKYGVNWTAMNGHLEVLKWLAQYSILPEIDDANDAARRGHLEVLKWLATEHNIFPNVEGANSAMIKQNVEILKWLATYNIFPDNIIFAHFL